MKRKQFLLPLALLLFVFANAQKAVDSTVSKSLTDQKTAAVNDINNQLTEKRKKLIDDVFHFSLKKKKQDDKTGKENDALPFQPGPGKTLIIIAGTDYTSLNSFADAVSANTQVKKVDSEFGDGTGSLKVFHSGTVKELLDDLLKRTGGRLDVTKSKDGVVNLQAK